MSTAQSSRGTSIPLRFVRCPPPSEADYLESRARGPVPALGALCSFSLPLPSDRQTEGGPHGQNDDSADDVVPEKGYVRGKVPDGGDGSHPREESVEGAAAAGEGDEGEEEDAEDGTVEEGAEAVDDLDE
jgi:hypothetical protein